MRALVIDDSKTMRLILGKLLKELKFEVYNADNGQDALAQLRKGPPPELVLVDWNMPVMNGLDFVKAVRADPAFQKTRLMMVTTEGGAEAVTTALTAGADEYVMKPFTKEMIKSKLALLGFDAL